jgi:hypothetical protein
LSTQVVLVNGNVGAGARAVEINILADPDRLLGRLDLSAVKD